MSRTIRSEVFFNEYAAAQAAATARSTYAHTTRAERAALRGATVRRTQKRAAVRNAPARGRVSADVARFLAFLACMAAGTLYFLAAAPLLVGLPMTWQGYEVAALVCFPGFAFYIVGAAFTARIGYPEA